MLRWFWDNKGSLLLSFVLAVTVWVAAVVAQDPTLERAMEEAVPIQYTFPNTGLQVVGNPPTEAHVTIKAPESVWQDISQVSFFGRLGQYRRSLAGNRGRWSVAL